MSVRSSLSVGFAFLIVLLVGQSAGWSAENDSEPLAPFIDGPWWQVAGDPDLGEYTTSKQQPVDFAVWKAADGTWQIWSCIRRTSCGGTGRLFHGWEGSAPTQKHWKPRGVMMTAKPELGETAGGLQAPHVVVHDGAYHMLYGDWENICLAIGSDGKKFERYVGPNGKTGLFNEEVGANTRDVISIKIGNLWHAYYTAFPNRQGAVYCRTSPDLKNWSESTTVAFGGCAGVDPFAAECPFVVERNGRYYLFRTQEYGEKAITRVYSSTDPMNFGINQDRLYLVGELPVAAPEIFEHEGQDYIAALLPSLKGIQIAKLGWRRPPKQGPAVFNFEDQSSRGRWKVVEGSLPEVFTQSTRQHFAPPMSHFIGTAETADGSFDDGQTAVVESPPFQVTARCLHAYLSGGVQGEKLYVSINDAQSGDELAKVSPVEQSNHLKPVAVDASGFLDRQVVLRVVDLSKDSWGHICFGGLFADSDILK